MLYDLLVSRRLDADAMKAARNGGVIAAATVVLNQLLVITSLLAAS